MSFFKALQLKINLNNKSTNLYAKVLDILELYILKRPNLFLPVLNSTYKKCQPEPLNQLHARQDQEIQVIKIYIPLVLVIPSSVLNRTCCQQRLKET